MPRPSKRSSLQEIAYFVGRAKTELSLASPALPDTDSEEISELFKKTISDLEELGRKVRRAALDASMASSLLGVKDGTQREDGSLGSSTCAGCSCSSGKKGKCH